MIKLQIVDFTSTSLADEINCRDEINFKLNVVLQIYSPRSQFQSKRVTREKTATYFLSRKKSRKLWYLSIVGFDSKSSAAEG
jgi:hypothetical protein